MPTTKKGTGESQLLAILCVCGEGSLRVRLEDGVEIVMPCTSCGSVDIAAARKKKSALQ